MNDTEEWWSLDKVESFYRECCAGCEEEPDPTISAAFKVRKNRPCNTFHTLILPPECLFIESTFSGLLWGSVDPDVGSHIVRCFYDRVGSAEGRVQGMRPGRTCMSILRAALLLSDAFSDTETHLALTTDPWDNIVPLGCV